MDSNTTWSDGYLNSTYWNSNTLWIPQKNIQVPRRQNSNLKVKLKVEKLKLKVKCSKLYACLFFDAVQDVWGCFWIAVDGLFVSSLCSQLSFLSRFQHKCLTKLDVCSALPSNNDFYYWNVVFLSLHGFMSA